LAALIEEPTLARSVAAAVTSSGAAMRNDIRVPPQLVESGLPPGSPSNPRQRVSLSGQVTAYFRYSEICFVRRPRNVSAMFGTGARARAGNSRPELIATRHGIPVDRNAAIAELENGVGVNACRRTGETANH
jgi:hypothetical protein